MPKIDEIFAFISIDEGPEDEGVVGWRFGETMMPLVGADKKRIDSLRPYAKVIAKIMGKRVVLAKFTVRQDIEVIDPKNP